MGKEAPWTIPKLKYAPAGKFVKFNFNVESMYAELNSASQYRYCMHRFSHNIIWDIIFPGAGINPSFSSGFCKSHTKQAERVLIPTSNFRGAAADKTVTLLYYSSKFKNSTSFGLLRTCCTANPQQIKCMELGLTTARISRLRRKQRTF